MFPEWDVLIWLFGDLDNPVLNRQNIIKLDIQQDQTLPYYIWKKKNRIHINGIFFFIDEFIKIEEMELTGAVFKGDDLTSTHSE